MKRLFLFAAFLGVACFPQGLWAATNDEISLSAAFTQVKGKVIVQDKKGKNRPVQKDSKVYEGETVHVHQNALASLMLFDGSTLDLKSGTNLLVSSLRQPSEKEKKISFKLYVGGILAKVQKLLTSRSSFEIEGGGVVCGVRGTKFEFSYDPDSNKVSLHVFEGSVFTTENGENNLFKAGDQMQFLNGAMLAPSAPQQNPASGNNSSLLNTNGQSQTSGTDQNLNNGADQSSSDSTAAVGDLSTQFDISNGVNSDNTFTDPSVEGSVRVTIHMNVPTNETHP